MDIITRQEKNLLLGSSICQEDIELNQFLSSFPKYKGVNENEIEKIKLKNKRVYLLLKSEDTRKAIINGSFGEWIIEQHIGEKPFPCELCGSPTSKDKYTIIDKKTKHKYKIGTSCVKRFPKEMRLKNGNDIFKMKEWTKEQLERSSEFYEVYEVGSSIFNEWSKKYNDLELLMPLEFENEFSYILKTGKKFYQDFINNTLPKNQTIKTFGYIDIDFNTFYKKCIKYINDNKNDRYICRKDMVVGIDKKIVSEIKKLEVCRINRYSARYINNIDFINKFVQDIRKMFKNINLELQDISNEGIKIEYSYKKNTQIILIISLQRFANKYSEVYFSSKANIQLSEVIKDSILMNTFENINKFLKLAKSLLKDKRYYFTYNERFHERKIIEVNDAFGYKYAIIKNNDELNKYIEIFNLSKEEAGEFLLEKLISLNWIDNKEKKKYAIGNISKTNTRTTKKDEEKQYNQYESEEEYYQRINKSKKKKLTIKI